MARVAHDFDSKDRTDDVIIEGNIDFKLMLLPKNILKGLLEAGFYKPSPIQLKAIPLGRCGCDLIVQAKAGTGKTCVFTVIVLDKIETSESSLQAIILAPTREISAQIKDVVATIGKYIEGLKVEYFVGGTSVVEDINKSKGCHIAVGSPGRIHHLIKDRHLVTNSVRVLVFDEADKLLETEFQKEIQKIYSSCPDHKQMIACSATYSPDMLSFLGEFFKSGLHVTPTKNPESVLLGIKKFVCVLPRHQDKLAIMKSKEKHLLYLLSKIRFNQCLIFSNFHSRTSSICNFLQKANWPATFINSKQTQDERFKAMNDLKTQVVRILVTTDLTARGIDAENVNLIINMDVPHDFVTYLHRMGRAGRYGSHGMEINILIEGDELTGFQKMLGAVRGRTFSTYLLPYNDIHADLLTCPIDRFQKISVIEPMKQDESPNNELLFDKSMNLNENHQLESTNNEIHEGIVIQCKDITRFSSLPIKNQSNYCGAGSTGNHNDISCTCDKLEIDHKSILKTTENTLYVINEKYNSSDPIFPICKNKLPLNIPLAVTNGKIIRLQKLNKFTFENNLKCDTITLRKCFEQIGNVNQIKSLKKQERSNSINTLIERFENKDVKEEQINSMLSKIQKIKEEELKYFKLCQIVKKYDLLGWLMLDENCNLIEDIQADNTKIIKLKLMKCSGNKMHIQVMNLGNLNSYLLKEDEHTSDVSTDVNYAFDTKSIPKEFLNNSLSNICNYFNSHRRKEPTKVTNNNSKREIKYSKHKRLQNKRVGNCNRDKERHISSIVPTSSRIQHPTDPLEDKQPMETRNKTDKVNAPQSSMDNLEANCTEGEQHTRGTDESHEIHHSIDLNWVPVVNEQFAGTCSAEVDCEGSNEQEVQNVNRPPYLIEYEQWYTSVQEQRKVIEYNVYMSCMFGDSD